MATVKGDVCVVAGRYQKDGEEKIRWQKIGILLESEKGFTINLTALPIGSGEDGNIWLKVFPPRDKPYEKPAPTQSKPESDDDIPF